MQTINLRTFTTACFLVLYASFSFASSTSSEYKKKSNVYDARVILSLSGTNSALLESSMITIVSDDETDYITRSINEKGECRFKLRSGVNYTFTCDGDMIVPFTRELMVAGTGEVTTYFQKLVINPLENSTGEMLGQHITLISFSSESTDESSYSSSTRNAIDELKSYSKINGTVQTISEVKFYNTAENIRDLLSDSDNLRFEFDRNSVVKYLVSQKADKNSSESYEQLTGSFESETAIMGSYMKKPAKKERPLVADVKSQNVNPTEAKPLNIKPLKAGPDFYFTVQLGSFSKEVKNPEATFKTSSIISNVVNGNQVKYFSGVFKSYEEASSHKEQLVTSGKEGVFIAAIKDGKRISMTEAMSYMSDSAASE